MNCTEPRLLTPDDAPAYVALRREMLVDTPWSFGASPDSDLGSREDSLRERIAQPENDIVGIFDADTGALVSVIGIVRSTGGKMRHRAMIWGVYTTPRARGQGLARRAMAAAIDLARTWDGVRVLGLSVSDEAPPALGLYESMGFVLWGREPLALVVDGVDHDELHMAMTL